MILSVILPVYNAEMFLKEAMDSVLSQTFADFELIIVNDGSTDDSLNIINSYNDDRILLINQENKGLAASLNIGIGIAKGKYIARMDADDVALPQRFEMQLNYLRNNPEVKLLGTAVNVMDSTGHIINVDIPYSGPVFISKYLFKVGNLFKHPTVIFEKEVVKKVGGYNEMIGKYFEDYFLWTQIAREHKVDILKIPLLNYRITPNSIMSSISTAELAEFRLKIVNKGAFDLSDLNELNELVRKDSHTDKQKETIYKDRILLMKKSRISNGYLKLKGLFGEKISMIIMSNIKKVRGYFLLLN